MKLKVLTYRGVRVTPPLICQGEQKTITVKYRGVSHTITIVQ